MFRMLAAMMLAVCLSVGISTAVFAACNGNAPYSSIVAGETLTVACTHGVNLRSYPDKSKGTIYTALPAGAHVYVMNKVASISGWLYVTYGDITGYVFTSDEHGNFFSHQGTGDKVTETPLSGYQAKVTASSLNVRSGYYITRPVVGFLSYGQAVDALATTSNGWVKVRYYAGTRQVVGYVSRSYVNLTKSKSDDDINAYTTFSPLLGCVADSKNEDDLTVYASPKTYSNVMAKLDEAEMVYITAKAKNNLWYQINFYDRGDDDDDDDDDYDPNALMQTGYVKAADVYVYRVFDKLKLSSAKTTLKVGKTKTLKVKDKYKFFSDVRMMGVTVKFKSSKKSVVAVNKNGLIRAKKKGKATITATVSIGSGIHKKTNKLTCKVTVVK